MMDWGSDGDHEDHSGVSKPNESNPSSHEVIGNVNANHHHHQHSGELKRKQADKKKKLPVTERVNNDAPPLQLALESTTARGEGLMPQLFNMEMITENKVEDFNQKNGDNKNSITTDGIPVVPKNTITTGRCMDSQTFLYQGQNGKTCLWLQEKITNRKRVKLCEEETEVKVNCPLTCNACCHDDPTFSFSHDEKDMSSTTTSTPAKNDPKSSIMMLDNKENINDRDVDQMKARLINCKSNAIRFFCNERKVRDACPLTCGVCEEQALSSSPPQFLASRTNSSLSKRKRLLQAKNNKASKRAKKSSPPLTQPTKIPSTKPSGTIVSPSSTPSTKPFRNPSSPPSSHSSLAPTTLSSHEPSTILPISTPTSDKPSPIPSPSPSSLPSKIPSKEPSTEPSSSIPSMQPSSKNEGLYASLESNPVGGSAGALIDFEFDESGQVGNRRNRNQARLLTLYF